MAYTAQELITRAWYLSGIVSRDLDSPSGSQIYEGLDLLNELLAIKTLDLGLIPFFREYTFNAVIGQQTYSIDNLAEIETMTFNIGPIRYQMCNVNRDKYFGAPRADNIRSLPYSYHMERKNGGADVYLYFLPQDTYLMKLWGKFEIDSIPTLQTDLSTTFELNYLVYLRYALAQFMCQDYNVSFSPDGTRTLMELEQKIRDISAEDYTMQKLSNLQSNNPGPDLYGQANLGKGWTSGWGA